MCQSGVVVHWRFFIPWSRSGNERDWVMGKCRTEVCRTSWQAKTSSAGQSLSRQWDLQPSNPPASRHPVLRSSTTRIFTPSCQLLSLSSSRILPRRLSHCTAFLCNFIPYQQYYRRHLLHHRRSFTRWTFAISPYPRTTFTSPHHSCSILHLPNDPDVAVPQPC